MSGHAPRNRKAADPRVCGATPKRPACACRLQGRSPRVRGNLGDLDALPAALRPIPACAGQPCGCGCRYSRPGADPRVCGATLPVFRNGLALQGRSPRVRGNPPLPPRGSCRLGPIPACAGQPWRTTRRATAATADPRVCGATSLNPSTRSASTGRSPRVRGNLSLAILIGITAGPIPACAGQPRWLGFVSFQAQADPRVCGATGLLCPDLACDVGRSPRVRGNPPGNRHSDS